MTQELRRFVWIACSSALLSCVLIPAASAQSAAPDISNGGPRDWSHRHLIYANPDTREEAARKGTVAFEQWKQKARDPRFAQQVARKARFAQPSAASGFSPQQLQWYKRNDRNPPAAAADVQRDWSNVLGGASGAGRAGIFPAKYGASFSVADCANDFVVYTTASAGATSTGAFATQTGSFTRNPTAGQTITVTHTGSPALVLTASTTSDLGLNFLIGGNTTATAINLANAIARNGGTAGVTASSAAAVVTVTSLTSGTTPNVTLAEGLGRFTWAGTSLTGGSGTAGQPTIIAFNQLYKGACGTTATQPVPATFWAYNTGNGAVAQTSPVLSGDGSQVAFVQTTGTAASLVLLKWSSTVSVGTVGAPTALTNQTLANYRSCTAPCMTVIPFSGNPNDTNSSPFYDYSADVLYVGADNGTLHKFTGVFNGTPAEQVSGGFPAAVSADNKLTSPVYDFGTGLVFVGSDTSPAAGPTYTGGQLHSVSASGVVVSSAPLAAYVIAATPTAETTGVSDSPIVDSGAQRVYVFVESDPNTGCGGVNCKAVYQFPTNVSISGSTGSRVNVGRGQVAARVLYAGAFDNAYYNSADSANPSGSLYVCGALADGSDSKKPTLWQIPITNNAMGNPAPGPILVDPTTYANEAYCSPVTEVMNGTNDYIYASVSGFGNKTGCTGACVYMFSAVPFVSFDTTSTPSTINNNTARYINISTPAALDTTETNVDTALTAAQAQQTYNAMIISLSAPSPAGTTFTFFLRSNGANTTLTCAIAAGATFCGDSLHPVTLAAGALVDVQVQRTAGTGTLTNTTFRVRLAAGPNATAGLPAPGGTGGIVVDNTAGNGGSQIYYSTITRPGNAVQASQAGLN
jgi:hypothetical protein